MTAFRRELNLVGTMADLSRIGQFIEDACAAAHVDPAARFDIQMAVDEACSNVFEHAYGGRAGEIDLRVETHGRDLVITVHDYGCTFDPDCIPTPQVHLPLEERPIGGLGLHLMRRLMDDVSFAFSPEQGNTLVMIKRNVTPAAARPARARRSVPRKS